MTSQAKAATGARITEMLADHDDAAKLQILSDLVARLAVDIEFGGGLAAQAAILLEKAANENKPAPEALKPMRDTDKAPPFHFSAPVYGVPPPPVTSPTTSQPRIRGAIVDGVVEPWNARTTTVKHIVLDDGTEIYPNRNGPGLLVVKPMSDEWIRGFFHGLVAVQKAMAEVSKTVPAPTFAAFLDEKITIERLKAAGITQEEIESLR